MLTSETPMTVRIIVGGLCFSFAGVAFGALAYLATEIAAMHWDWRISPVLVAVSAFECFAGLFFGLIGAGVAFSPRARERNP